jgi:hypothetical protein
MSGYEREDVSAAMTADEGSTDFEDMDTSRIGSRDTDRAQEIDIKTNWRGALQEAPLALSANQVDDKEVWLINNFFSADECTRLLAAAEEKGFGGTHYPKDYRGNLRLLTTDLGLADALWERLRPLVPATFSQKGYTWTAVGLNECWRLAKYHENDQFKGHCDASFMRNRDEMSMLTVNIYMNGDFEGGRTRFYFQDERKADLSVVPETGLCLVFRQPPGKNYYHDGEKLSSGVKYLFRSDVMYRRTAKN